MLQALSCDNHPAAAVFLSITSYREPGVMRPASMKTSSKPVQTRREIYKIPSATDDHGWADVDGAPVVYMKTTAYPVCF